MAESKIQNTLGGLNDDNWNGQTPISSRSSANVAPVKSVVTRDNDGTISIQVPTGNLK